MDDVAAAGISGGNVACLIVTYQDRRDLLRRVIRRLGEITPSIGGVVVVFNGVPYDPTEFLEEFEGSLKLQEVVFSTNMGSACGYAAALEKVREHPWAEYCWLLDDDNLPDMQALQQLDAAHALLGRDKQCLLLSLREDRWEYLKLVHTGEWHQLKPDSFFGFHVGTTLSRKLAAKEPIRFSKGSAANYPLLKVGHAPYGGLLMHRNWMDRVGFPKREFFVYEDDHEYTDRITHAGGRIYLCASSRIQDIEESWFLNNPGHCHYLVDPGASGLKAFCAIRNRVHLESNRYIKSQAVYKLNAMVFALRVVASAHRHWSDRRFWMRLRLLAAAYKEGRSGSLRVMDDGLKHWINDYG